MIIFLMDTPYPASPFKSPLRDRFHLFWTPHCIDSSLKAFLESRLLLLWNLRASPADVSGARSVSTSPPLGFHQIIWTEATHSKAAMPSPISTAPAPTKFNSYLRPAVFCPRISSYQSPLDDKMRSPWNEHSLTASQIRLSCCAFISFRSRPRIWRRS